MNCAVKYVEKVQYLCATLGERMNFFVHIMGGVVGTLGRVLWWDWALGRKAVRFPFSGLTFDLCGSLP